MKIKDIVEKASPPPPPQKKKKTDRNQCGEEDSSLS
jgi:hypothetical protein